MKSTWIPWWITLILFLCAAQCLADMRLPPIIVVSPRTDIIYKSGARIELPCTATGISAPSYTWYKDDVELEITGSITRPNDDDGLIIIDPARTDLGHDGIYICKAKNPHGEASSAAIYVHQTELTYNSPTVPTQRNRIQGESLELELYDTLTSIPVASYQWKIVLLDANTGDALTTSTRIAVDQSSGSLYFANLIPGDQPIDGYIYKLDVTNTFEDATFGGSPYDLTVDDSEVQNRAPNRMVPTVEDYRYVALKGNDAVIKCFFGGFPTPLVSWRPPVTGPPPGRIDCTQESDTECLINNVEYSDEGIYTCQGTNSEGDVSVDINFIVDSVPTFVTAPASQNVTAGNRASFLCIPDAKPDAVITWYSNGNEINRADPGSSRIIISEDSTNLTVIMVCKDCEGQPSDLQVFQCKISNEHGADYASAYLNVLDPIVLIDQGEEQDVEVDLDLGEALEVNFTCVAETDELVQDDLEHGWWYQGQRLYNGVPYTIDNNGQNLHINLTGLEEGDYALYLGEYSCRAFTIYNMVEGLYSFTIKGYEPPEPYRATVADFWWLFLLIFLLLLILLLLICCVMYMQRNKGDGYPVDYYERENGNDPLEECKEADFHDYQRRSLDLGGVMKGSRASLGSSQQALDDDMSTFNGQYDNDGIKISEEGSYLGHYNTYNRPQINVPSHAISNA